MNARKLGLIFALLGSFCLIETTHADLTPTSSSKAVIVGALNSLQSFVGSLIVKSSSSTSGFKPFLVQNNSGSEVLSVTQGGVGNLAGALSVGGGLTMAGDLTVNSGGNVTLNGGGKFSGDGSQLTGIPGSASTTTWSGANKYTSTTTLSGTTILNGLTQVGSGLTGFGSVPTRQVLTSGTGATYTTPASVRQIRVRECGGGGGGGGYSTVNGGNGGDTSFNGIVASHGIGGGAARAANGGAGGSGGTGSASFRMAGNGGSGGGDSNGGGGGQGVGGTGPFGGGAFGYGYQISPTTGQSAPANSCAGGGGGGDNVGDMSAGGGAGEYVEIILNAPLAGTYTFSVGAGGSGGVGSPATGGTGGSGLIIVDEFY